MDSASDESVGPVADRRRWLALAVVMTASFLDLVDVTIVNVAVPRIEEDLGASFSSIQWITAGYALAFAIGLITGGRLGDIYGRKRLFLIGMAGFTVVSAVCGLAPGPETLVVARFLQGAMAALMVPQVLSIIHVTFPAEERGKVFGMFGAMIGLGAVAGPMIGALLTEWNLFGLEWRPIFLVNLPVGIGKPRARTALHQRVPGTAGAPPRPGRRGAGQRRTAAAPLPADAGQGAGLAAVGLPLDGRRRARVRRLRLVRA